MVSVQQRLVSDQLITHRACLISLTLVDQLLLRVLVFPFLKDDAFAIRGGCEDILDPEPGLSKQVLQTGCRPYARHSARAALTSILEPILIEEISGHDQLVDDIFDLCRDMQFVILTLSLGPIRPGEGGDQQRVINPADIQIYQEGLQSLPTGVLSCVGFRSVGSRERICASYSRSTRASTSGWSDQRWTSKSRE